MTMKKFFYLRNQITKSSFPVKLRTKGVRQIHWKDKTKLLIKLILEEIRGYGEWKSFLFKNQLQETILMNIYSQTIRSCWSNIIIFL